MTSFSAGDVNLTAVMAAETQVMKGYNALTLTHMSDTTVPAIAAGSAIEVNGVLVQSLTETAISGSPSDGVVYIYINGTTPTFTNTAPTWSDLKQGWYGTGGSANYRYVASCLKATASYTLKDVNTFNTASNVSNIVNLRTGLQHNSEYVAGYTLAGSPMFMTMLTGSLSGTSLSVNYPSGYTKTNTNILSLIVQMTSGSVPGDWLVATGLNIASLIYLRDTTIEIVSAAATISGGSYRLLIARF